LIICPCCGAKAHADANTQPCAGCGALSVGPPLARPEFELPSYGLTAAVAGAGLIVAATFAASTAFALFERKPFSLDLWNVMAAAETSAWRLRWALLPLSIAAFVGGARALMHVSREPSRHAGVRCALGGLTTSAMVAVAMLALIGVTVPARLNQRDLAAEAARNAEAYDAVKALLEYQQQYGTLPTSAEELKKLPDPDGTMARAARMISAGRYEPESTIASLPAAAKSRGRRSTNVTVRPVSLRAGAEEPQGEPLSFTNYTLRLAGEDRKLGTADDLLIRDGMIMRAPPAGQSARTPGVKNVP
jgi:hypothetical protein